MTKLYQHPSGADVAFEVLKSFYVLEKDLYKLRVRWWNTGKCHRPWCMGLEEKLELPRKKWREFILLGEEQWLES